MTIPISILSGGTRREDVPGRQVELRDGASGASLASSRVLRPTWKNATLAEINKILELATIGVQFEFDQETETMIARVMDVKTGKVIRRMPSDEVMQLSRALGKLHDLLVHQAICRKAQAANNSQTPAPARWSSPWVTSVSSRAAGRQAQVNESSASQEPVCP